MEHRFILVVEDDNEDRVLLQEAFKAAGGGSQLHFLSCGSEVEPYLGGLPETMQPALLLLDYHTPRMNGTETLRLVRRQHRFGHLPAVVYSTTIPQAIKEELTAMGVLACVEKAISFKQLVAQCSYFKTLASGNPPHAPAAPSAA